MRRRDFLTTVAAAGLLPQMSGRAAAQAPAAARAERLKLGVASYSLRKFPFDKALEMAKACDVQLHQLQGRPSAAHRPARRNQGRDAPRPRPRASRSWAAARSRGCRSDTPEETPSRCARTSSTRSSPACRSSSRRRASKRSTPSRRLAKEFEIKVAIHNHGPEDKFFPVAVRRLQARQGARQAHGAVRRHRPHVARRRRSDQGGPRAAATASTISTSRTCAISRTATAR